MRKASNDCGRPGRTGICCATRLPQKATTKVCTPKPCPLRTEWRAYGFCEVWGIRWAAASWSARRDRQWRPGSRAQPVDLLSIIRLLGPNVLLPATTALGTIDPVGREKGILAGANVVMPNLSPVAVRKKYELYENKICTGEESAQCRGCLAERMASIGFEIVTDRGDVKRTQAACRKQTVGK